MQNKFHIYQIVGSALSLLLLQACATASRPWVPPVIITQDSQYRVEARVTDSPEHYLLAGRLHHAHGRYYGAKCATVQLLTDGTVKQEWAVPIGKAPFAGSRIKHSGGKYNPNFKLEVPKPIPETSRLTIRVDAECSEQL